MNCPYCGSPMTSSGPMLDGCDGRMGANHEPIQYCSMDRSFQTYSDQIAQWFRQKGYRVEKPGKMYDIYER